MPMEHSLLQTSFPEKFWRSVRELVRSHDSFPMTVLLDFQFLLVSIPMEAPGAAHVILSQALERAVHTPRWLEHFSMRWGIFLFFLREAAWRSVAGPILVRHVRLWSRESRARTSRPQTGRWS